MSTKMGIICAKCPHLGRTEIQITNFRVYFCKIAENPNYGTIAIVRGLEVKLKEDFKIPTSCPYILEHAFNAETISDVG